MSKTNQTDDLNIFGEDGFFEVNVDTLEEGIRETRGFSGDGKYLRQKDHLSEFDKTICFRILPHTVESMKFYHGRKTLPFATVPHGWFIHPTKQVDDNKGGKKSHRMFHISPQALGDTDRVSAFLNTTLKDLPGYKGAPDEHVDELVQIFQSLYTNNDPRYRHLGGPKKDKLPDLAEAIEKDYPGYKTAEYIAMAKKIRYVYKIFKYKYLMPIVLVGEELDENGQSVPLTNQAQILDFEGVIKNAIFGKKGGLIEENKKLTPAKAKRKKLPFQAYRQFFSNKHSLPAYDIFLESFENRQFVGDDPERKGYVDFHAYFREVPTTLADGESYYEEANRYDILEEVRNGIRDEDLIIDMFKVHFGLMEEDEFNELHPDTKEETSTTNSAETEADAIVEEAKTKKTSTAKASTKKKTAPEPEEEEEPVAEDQQGGEESEEVTKLVQSIESLEAMPNVDVPQALFDKYKELTGKDWVQEEEEEPVAEAEPEKKKTTTNKTTGTGSRKGGSRKRANV